MVQHVAPLPAWVKKVMAVNKQISNKKGPKYEKWKQSMISYYERKIQELKYGRTSREGSFKRVPDNKVS